MLLWPSQIIMIEIDGHILVRTHSELLPLGNSGGLYEFLIQRWSPISCMCNNDILNYKYVHTHVQ